MQTHAVKKSGWGTRLILALVLLSVVGGQFFVAPSSVQAADSNMSDVFPPSSTPIDVGVGLPPEISTTGTAYSGWDPDGIVDQTQYVVSGANLKLEANNAHQNTGTNAFFYATISLGGRQQGAFDYDRDGQYENDEELGSWQSLYDASSDGTLPPEGDSSQGVFLQIGTGIAVYDGSVTEELVTPPVAPVLQNIVGTPIPLLDVIDFKLTSQRIPITIGTAAGLQPNTSYYGRIVLQEDNSAAEAYSNILVFRTGAATTDPETAEDISLTENEEIVGATENTGDILAMSECGANPITWFSDCFVNLFYWILYTPSHWLVLATSWFLDATTVFSIASTTYKNPSFITEGWRIVRDVSNIFFIIMLVYIAFAVLLDLGVKWKEALAQLVIAALLINFSLFFTRVVVDSSNILARIFYHQIQISGSNRPALSDPTKFNVEEKSLSQAIGDGLHINKMMSPEMIQKMRAEGYANASYAFLIVLLGTLVNIVAAGSFFMTGLFFIGRIVGLWVVMIFSAFAFLTRAVPFLNKVPQISWGSWFSELFNLSFLAPIYIFFVYLIISFINQGFLDGLFRNIDDFSFTSMVVSIAIQFAILITLIKMSRNLAKKLSGETGGALAEAFSKTAGAVTGFATGAALAVTTGGIAAAGRTVIGGAASKLSDSQTLRAREARGGVRGWMASKTLKASDYLKKASFDPRATSSFKGAMTSLGSMVDAKFTTGKPQEGGYAGTKEREQKEREKRAKAILVSSDEAAKTAPENTLANKKYTETLRIYDANKKAYDAYNAHFERAKEAAKNTNPAFDETAFKAQYERDFRNRTGKNAPTDPGAAPEQKDFGFKSKEDINKQRTEEYAQSLRDRTLNAQLKENTFGVLGGGATREGELSAADKLKGALAKQNTEIAKINENTEKHLNELNDLSNKVTNSLDKSKKALRKFTDELSKVESLVGNKSPQDIQDEASRVRSTLTTDNLDIKELERAYANEQDAQKKNQLKGDLTKRILARDKKQSDLTDLENAFKNKDRIEKDIAKIESEIASKEDSLLKITDRKAQTEELRKQKTEKAKEPLKPE